MCLIKCIELPPQRHHAATREKRNHRAAETFRRKSRSGPVSRTRSPIPSPLTSAIRRASAGKDDDGRGAKQPSPPGCRQRDQAGEASEIPVCSPAAYSWPNESRAGAAGQAGSCRNLVATPVAMAVVAGITRRRVSAVGSCPKPGGPPDPDRVEQPGKTKRTNQNTRPYAALQVKMDSKKRSRRLGGRKPWLGRRCARRARRKLAAGPR